MLGGTHYMNMWNKIYERVRLILILTTEKINTF